MIAGVCGSSNQYIYLRLTFLGAGFAAAFAGAAALGAAAFFAGAALGAVFFMLLSFWFGLTQHSQQFDN